MITSLLGVIADRADLYSDYGTDAYKAFISEIKENTEKINESYNSVLWKYDDDSDGEDDNWGSASFTYEKGEL